MELGLTLGHLRHTEQAKLHFQRALELQPLHIDARINLAVALLKTGEPAAAASELERVLVLHPGHAAALDYLEAARRLSR